MVEPKQSEPHFLPRGVMLECRKKEEPYRPGGNAFGSFICFSNSWAVAGDTRWRARQQRKVAVRAPNMRSGET